MYLNDLAKKIHSNSVKHGFYKDNPHIATQLMLVVSELSEALEADQKGKHSVSPEFYDKMFYIKGYLAEHFNQDFENKTKDSFEDEIADAIIRLLDIAAWKNINIEKHIKLKMRYNATRPYLHGKKY